MRQGIIIDSLGFWPLTKVTEGFLPCWLDRGPPWIESISCVNGVVLSPSKLTRYTNQVRQLFHHHIYQIIRENNRYETSTTRAWKCESLLTVLDTIYLHFLERITFWFSWENDALYTPYITKICLLYVSENFPPRAVQGEVTMAIPEKVFFAATMSDWIEKVNPSLWSTMEAGGRRDIVSI